MSVGVMNIYCGTHPTELIKYRPIRHMVYGMGWRKKWSESCCKIKTLRYNLIPEPKSSLYYLDLPSDLPYVRRFRRAKQVCKKNPVFIV